MKNTTLKPIRQGFRPGSTGTCEALLFEFSDEALDDAPQLHRVAATSLLEAVNYIASREPDYRPRSVRDLGIIILVSGSPHR